MDREDDGRNKALPGSDREFELATMVEKKEVNPYAVAAASRAIGNSGFRMILLKSVQEPAFLTLMEAVKNERAEKIKMLLEKSHTGEPTPNVEVTDDVRGFRRHVRTMKTALASRYDMIVAVEESHRMLPWLMMHAATLISICHVGSDGKTTYAWRRGNKN